MNKSESWEEWIDVWSGFWLEGVALPIVAAFGIIGEKFYWQKKTWNIYAENECSNTNSLEILETFFFISWRQKYIWFFQEIFFSKILRGVIKKNGKKAVRKM